MLTINEILIVQQLAIFVSLDEKNISLIAEELGCSVDSLQITINKFKECEINVKKN